MCWAMQDYQSKPPTSGAWSLDLVWWLFIVSPLYSSPPSWSLMEQVKPMIIISNRNQNRGSLAAILWGENDISSDANVLGHAALLVKTSYIGRVVSWSCVMVIHSSTPVQFAAQLIIDGYTFSQLIEQVKPMIIIVNRNQNRGSLAVMLWG